MKLVIINYGAGNIKSIQFAFKRLGVDAILSDDADEIINADKVIFPGVGEASSAMKKLKKSGLDQVIPGLKQPVLGICLGMQLMTLQSEEGKDKGFGWFDQSTIRFNATSGIKVPHMGWSDVKFSKSSKLSKGLEEEARFYFVHSYCFIPDDPAHVLAQTRYGEEFASAVRKDAIFGLQFHPEKSQSAGLKLISNFLKFTAGGVYG